MEHTIGLKKAVRVQFQNLEKLCQLKVIIIVSKVILKPLDQLSIFKQHAQILQKFTIFQNHLPVHETEPLIDITPQVGEQILILIQNIIFIVILHQVE